MGKIKNAIYWLHEWQRYITIRKKYMPFQKYLLDAESKRIMRLRGKFISHPDIEAFLKDFAGSGMTFEIPELDIYAVSNIIICLMEEDNTAIKRMRYTQLLLQHSKYRERYSCIKYSDGSEHFGSYTKDTIIVPVWGANFDITTLQHDFWEPATLHIPPYAEVLIGVVGKQYFDVWDPAPNEVVIDCGAYDGTTELQIAEWSNYNYKKIYALEPNETNCQKCELFYQNNNLENIELIPKASWSRNTTLSFSVEQGKASSGGKIGGGDSCEILATAIDDITGNDKVTFIKMDVEGAELESLKGAAKTIQQDSPKLAICIYHKFEDLWEIPEYILKLNANYRFYIRHYTSYLYETVLYAIAK